MRIGLVSTDEVNRELARQMITAEMRLEHSNNGTANRNMDAWIYDLDQLPAEERQLLLHKLSRATPPQPVAVLSYSLPGQLRRRLRANQVLVRRRLDVDVFKALRAKVLRQTGKTTASLASAAAS